MRASRQVAGGGWAYRDVLDADLVTNRQRLVTLDAGVEAGGREEEREG